MGIAVIDSVVKPVPPLDRGSLRFLRSKTGFGLESIGRAVRKNAQSVANPGSTHNAEALDKTLANPIDALEAPFRIQLRQKVGIKMAEDLRYNIGVVECGSVDDHAHVPSRLEANITFGEDRLKKRARKPWSQWCHGSWLSLLAIGMVVRFQIGYFNSEINVMERLRLSRRMSLEAEEVSPDKPTTFIAKINLDRQFSTVPPEVTDPACSETQSQVQNAGRCILPGH